MATLNDPTPPARPSQVVKATWLLCASLAIGVVNSAMDWERLSSLSSPGFAFSIMVFVFALMAFLIYKIFFGRNWARIIFLVLFVVGTLPYTPALLAMFESSVLVGSLGVAQLVLQVVALFLIFTHPGKTWFRRRGTSW